MQRYCTRSRSRNRTVVLAFALFELDISCNSPGELRESEVRPHPEAPTNKDPHADIDACKSSAEILPNVPSQIAFFDDIIYCKFDLHPSINMQELVQYLCLDDSVETDLDETSMTYLYQACDDGSSSSGSSDSSSSSDKKKKKKKKSKKSKKAKKPKAGHTCRD